LISLLVTAVEFLVGALMVMLLLAWARREPPWSVMRRALGTMVGLRDYRTPLLVVLGLLAFDVTET
jgi:hypothetical protein